MIASSEMPTPITLEQIKSGEVTGRQALEWLADQHKFVFHGTTQLINDFEPRQATNEDQPDGPPAVFATDNIDIAIFRSLIHREHDTLANRSHISSFEAVIDQDHQTRWQFHTLPGEINRIKQDRRTGYVAVLPIKQFQSKRRGEIISTTPVQAILNVKTTIADLPPILEDLTLP